MNRYFKQNNFYDYNNQIYYNNNAVKKDLRQRANKQNTKYKYYEENNNKINDFEKKREEPLGNKIKGFTIENNDNDKDHKNQNLESEIKNLRKKINEQNLKIEYYEECINKNKINDLEKENEEYKKNKIELENKIKDLTRENNEKDNKNKNLENEIKVLRKRANDQNSQIKNYEECINNFNDLTKRLEESKKNYIKLENKIKDLTRENNEKDNKIKNLDNDLEKEKEESKESKKKNIKLENKIKDLTRENNEKDKKNKNLESENKEFRKSINEKSNKIIEEKNKNLCLENEKKNLQKQVEDRTKENEEEQKKIINLEKTINNLNKRMSEKNNIISEEQKKSNILEKENQQIHIKFDGALKEFAENSDQNRKLKEELSKYKDYKKENEALSMQLDKLRTQNETKIDYINNSADKYYDVVINIDSINSLRNEGWEILYNEDRKENYEKIVNEQTIKIGVLGLNNVGKSYLLSKIVKVDIPTGHSVETKGISIKYSEGEKGEEAGICILDSAGFETPLLSNDKYIKDELQKKEGPSKQEIEEFNKMIELNKIEDILARDKAQTERFIEHLIISFSDMIILVVGKLTRTEQRLITRIKNMAKISENKIKSIIIVHNLAQYNKKIEVENHINNYLLHSATFKLIKKNVVGIKEYSDRFYFVEESEDIEVFHYIMAKEETEAGIYYNKLTLQLIKNQYNNSNTRREIDIPEQIKKKFCELSNEIIGEKINPDQLETIEGKKIKIKENSEIIKDNNGSDILPIQNAYIDQDGNYLQNKGKFEPKYSVFIYKEGDDDDFENFLLLRIEVPGNVTRLTARGTDPKKEKYRGIIINIHKEEDNIEEEKEKYKTFKKMYDNRNYEEINYFIEFKGNLRNLILNKKVPIEDTKIYEIKFDERNKEKYFKENNQITKINEEANNKNIKEGKKIACGVYILRFSLTQDSF